MPLSVLRAAPGGVPNVQPLPQIAPLRPGTDGIAAQLPAMPQQPPPTLSANPDGPLKPELGPSTLVARQAAATTAPPVQARCDHVRVRRS